MLVSRQRQTLESASRCFTKMMNLFLAVLTVMAVSATPIEKSGANQKHLIITSEMPALGANTFNRMVGACTYKNILYDTHSCQKDFYMSFRTEPNKKCSVRFEPLKECLMKKMHACFKPVLKAPELKAIMSKYAMSMVTLSKHSCGEEEYSLSMYMKGSSKHCKPRTAQKIDKCPQRFFKMFKKNGGDLRLCSVYRNHTQCMKNTIEESCSFDFSKSAWIFDNALNPFCDDKQLKDIAEAGRSKRSLFLLKHHGGGGGRLPEDIVEGKSKDTDHDDHLSLMIHSSNIAFFSAGI